MAKNTKEGVIQLRLDILSALKAGKTNAEICTLLKISTTTLTTHKKLIVDGITKTLQDEFHYRLVETVAKHEQEDLQIIRYCDKVIANCASIEEYNEKLEKTFALRGDARADLISLYSNGSLIIGGNNNTDNNEQEEIQPDGNSTKENRPVTSTNTKTKQS